MTIWTDVNLSTSPMVRELHGWWTSHRGASGIADRKDLDPIALRHLLPNVMICEAETDPFRVRYRLVGTKVVDVTSFNFTGRYLDDVIAGGSDTPWLKYYQTVFTSRSPLLGAVTEATMTGGTFTYEFGIFPLSLGGSAVQQFISLEDYFGFRLTSAELQVWPKP